MEHHIKEKIYELLNNKNNKNIKVFIDIDNNRFSGDLDSKSFVMFGDDHIVLNNPVSKRSGNLKIKEAFIKISSITSFTYIIIDLETKK